MAEQRETRWKERIPPNRAWKPRVGTTAKSRAAEQDRAAGGRSHRTVETSDGGCARASVALRLYRRTRRIRAYLRWSEGGRTRERYIGEVDGVTRAQNLNLAWGLAHSAGLAGERPLPDFSWASTVATRVIMRANKSRDTAPELRLRSKLHRMGLRYRVSIRPIPNLRRTSDIVFPKARVAVFVDGCYWHGCPDHHRPAQRNAEFWSTKIAANRARDADTNRRLAEAGWTVLRFWEHDDLDQAAIAVSEAVRARCAS